MKKINDAMTLCYLIPIITFLSCGKSADRPGISNQSRSTVPNSEIWDIPKNEVFDGGPGKDGIPALLTPELITAAETDYLNNRDLVLGYKNGDETIAYPHRILDWHEIINDESGDHKFAVTYCPLTGTGIGWERSLVGEETTFGVSGLIYNNNLIPYDRKTDSYWSQILQKCVNGELRGQEVNTFQLLETTWATWKHLYPDTRVVSRNTGFSRDYNVYPYGDYKTNHDKILFPYFPKDQRLKAKERVHGIIIRGSVRAYRFESFDVELSLIEDVFNGIPIVVVGSRRMNFIVSFERNLEDGTQLDFTVIEKNDNVQSSLILQDNEGNQWDLFGEAISGPRKGQRLTSTNSFMGYWFTWSSFFLDVDIFKN